MAQSLAAPACMANILGLGQDSKISISYFNSRSLIANIKEYSIKFTNPFNATAIIVIHLEKDLVDLELDGYI